MSGSREPPDRREIPMQKTPAPRAINQTPAWDEGQQPTPALGQVPCIHPTAKIVESRIGAWTEIGAYTTIIESTVDDYSYIAAPGAYLTCARVGKFTSIAAHVRINPVNHPLERVTQHHCTYHRRQYGFAETDDESFFAARRERYVTVGPDVWLGHGAVIMPGVTIAPGAAVGSGAVVTKDVAPYTVVVGVPARPLRRRFTSSQCDRLLAIAWWDWPHEKLKEHFALLSGPIDAFLERFSA